MLNIKMKQETIDLDKQKEWSPVIGRQEMKILPRLKNIGWAYSDWLGGMGHFKGKSLLNEIKNTFISPAKKLPEFKLRRFKNIL